jgi:hypothetical protein
MKVLITENQSYSVVNKIIQDTFNYLKNGCYGYDEGQEPGDDYNWDDCDLINVIDKIVLNDIEKLEPNQNFNNNKYPTFAAWVNIYYDSIFNTNFDNLESVFNHIIYQKYKLKIKLRIQEEINTNKNRNW